MQVKPGVLLNLEALLIAVLYARIGISGKNFPPTDLSELINFRGAGLKESVMVSGPTREQSSAERWPGTATAARACRQARSSRTGRERPQYR